MTVKNKTDKDIRDSSLQLPNIVREHKAKAPKQTKIGDLNCDYELTYLT